MCLSRVGNIVIDTTM
ncbi:hypothetical protein F383_00144 [Gossypium arboreum]|uniref:Uncharacterized protein n=1 Tax=Gossypium arboreum TaxID=29729 RepID=A0A0B0P4H6_GOSAR|nr:hypothetical protein F383_00144 [Gossypium arboreum]